MGNSHRYRRWKAFGLYATYVGWLDTIGGANRMKAGRIIGGAIAMVVLITLGLVVSGIGGDLFFKGFVAFNKPAGDFDANHAVAAPDYSLFRNWASLPSLEDLADQVPQGVQVSSQKSRPVDVFFIHPTGLINAGAWVSPMQEASATAENTHFMMANQASVFNGCCDIYAPRYRQANIFSYFLSSIEDRDIILDFAYQDVRRAFEYYLQHKNEGKPFIIAGHSQGSHHAKRLLEELIDPTDLHRRLIAAYLLGPIIIPVTTAWIDSLEHVRACMSEGDLGCIVAWDAMPEGKPPLPRDEQSLCTNPLLWQVTQQRAPASLNEGSLVPVGTFNGNIGSLSDEPVGQHYGPLAKPIKALTGAQCRQGTLYASPSLPAGFEEDAMGTYHQLDYALFYMNIFSNAKLRSTRYLSTIEGVTPSH